MGCACGGVGQCGCGCGLEVHAWDADMLVRMRMSHAHASGILAMLARGPPLAVGALIGMRMRIASIRVECMYATCSDVAYSVAWRLRMRRGSLQGSEALS